jgi:ornithine carbamoyltransferase
MPAVTTRKDFLSVLDFGPAELERCLAIASRVKADRPLGRQAPTADLLAEYAAAAPRLHAEKALLAILLSPTRPVRRDPTQP